MSKKGNKTQSEEQKKVAKQQETEKQVTETPSSEEANEVTESNDTETTTAPAPEEAVVESDGVEETEEVTESNDTETESAPAPSFEPSLIDKEDPIKRASNNSEIYKMAAGTLKELTERLDVPALPNYRDDSICKVYISLYREIVRCLNVEKTRLNKIIAFFI